MKKNEKIVQEKIEYKWRKEKKSFIDDKRASKNNRKIRKKSFK